MNKQEFLAELRRQLSGIPQEDIEERLTFYNEMIEDQMEEGMTEQAVIAGFGSVEEIASRIMAEIPLVRLVKERVKPKRRLNSWEIVLLVLGSPVWLSLTIAAAAVIFSVYAVIWSLIIALWAIELSVAICVPAGLFSFLVLTVKGNGTAGLAMLGIAFACVGIAIFGFFACRQATKAVLTLTKKLYILIKSCFIKKEAAK